MAKTSVNSYLLENLTLPIKRIYLEIEGERERERDSDVFAKNIHTV